MSQTQGKVVSTISKDELVRLYIEHGYALTNLKGKVPPEGWNKTKPDPTREPEDYPKNYGIVLQDDDMVIDVDPRHFAANDNPIIRLMTDLGLPPNPNTYIVQTGGEMPGLHIYMKKDPAIKTRETLEGYKGLEFKVKGRQVVGPGSIHPETGEAYRVICGTPAYAMQAPVELLLWLEREENFEDGEALGEYKDDNPTQQRYINYLKNAPAAIQGTMGDLATYKTACQGRDLGLSPEMVYDLMADHWNPRCQPPWGLSELKSKVKHAYRYAKRPQGVSHPEYDFDDMEVGADRTTAEEKANLKWDMDKNGAPKPTLSNTVSYFLIDDYKSYKNPLFHLLRYNSFADTIEFNYAAPWHEAGRPIGTWTDSDTLMLKHWLATKKHFNTTTMLCHEAAIVVAQRFGSYHPVVNYLDGLKWDGKARLDKVLVTYTGAENTPYVRAVGKNVLLAAVARVYNPGCQFDHMLILEGEQGTGKSSFCRALGGEWFADINIDPHQKDTVDAMRGRWIIEASEMECARKSDVQALKAFITKTIDNVRPAYARSTVAFPRQCVFIGTINPEAGGAYLRDQTGNRRFWPVKTQGDIKVKDLRRDRDQLFAEAVVRYRAGERFYLHDSNLIKLAELEQLKRTNEDPFEEHIISWMVHAQANKSLPHTVTSTFISTQVLGISPKTAKADESRRIAHCMKKLGWDYGRFYVEELNCTRMCFRLQQDMTVLEDL